MTGYRKVHQTFLVQTYTNSVYLRILKRSLKPFLDIFDSFVKHKLSINTSKKIKSKIMTQDIKELRIKCKYC